ncbi:hypothetical protein B0H17DRAFT_1200586 [Mycena rosella]|uniref:Meiotically up-regulated protein Msb1/Mug8 domain-containing protein n=1 Tax=Mycena rosella TaxID=1033263 RepID=A0AAD7DIU7_MYCRO|nr:hypothetical protein B0H17DRAFT_1200586 [Mycena rosella]
MQSLFSRARTASTPSKSKHKPPLTVAPVPDSARSSRRGTPTDEFGQRTPVRTSSLPTGADGGYGAVGFLPTTLPVDPAIPFAPPPDAPAASNNGLLALGGPPPPRAAYGLLSPARDAVLGLPDAARLVARVCEALERTGVATPFVFSALALDVRRAAVARLVHAFLATCGPGEGHPPAEARWVEETRFAGAHELGMCLRWGLSRVVRVEGGREVRGLLSWAWYERWKAEEAGRRVHEGVWSVYTAQGGHAPGLSMPASERRRRAALIRHGPGSSSAPPSVAGPALGGLAGRRRQR